MDEMCNFIHAGEFQCLYFHPHFLKAFKKNISIESAEVIESTEDVLYCKQYMKNDIRKFVFSRQPF